MATRFNSVIAFLAAVMVVATAACANEPAPDVAKEIEELNKFIQLDPNDAVAYYNRGNAYDELGEYQLAIQDFNKAIQLDPNYALAYHHRGNAYRELGIKGKAYADKMQACYLDKQYC